MRVKKQISQKLQFLLKGLEERLVNNEDFFQTIKIDFISGKQTFLAKLEYASPTRLRYHFQGVTKEFSFRDLSQEVTKDAEKFDCLQLLFLERGTQIRITADQRDVKIKYQDVSQEESKSFHHDNFQERQLGNRDYYIKVGQADELLKAIGIMTARGKIKNEMIRKYNQIDRYVELMVEMIKKLEEGDQQLTILDCGCGKSYLLFVLNFYLKNILKTDCYFIGLDSSPEVIATSKKIAQDLEYRNMHFYETDIKKFIPQRKIDLVISLHACDTATDEALALALKCQSRGIVAVPCCHAELLNQYSFQLLAPVLKHGVFKARLADLLTDGLRSLYLEAQGYKTSVIEYISPLETPKNLMIRAFKVGEENRQALQEYQALKGILHIKPTLEYLNNARK